MIKYLRPVILVLIIAAWSRPVAGQIAVYDIGTWVKLGQQILHEKDIVEQTTNTVNQLANIAKRLGGDQGRFRTIPIAKNTWDLPGVIAPARVPGLPDIEEIVASMRAGDGRRQLENLLAWQFVSIRTHQHAIKAANNVQIDANGPLAEAMAALNAAVVSPDKEDHRVAALLGKLAAGSGIQAHQNEGLTQVAIGTLNQLGIMQQRAINAEISQLNMAVTNLEQPAFGQTYISGSAEALRAWRLP